MPTLKMKELCTLHTKLLDDIKVTVVVTKWEFSLSLPTRGKIICVGFFHFSVIFWNKVLLCSPKCPQTLNHPASGFQVQVLGLQVYMTCPAQKDKIFRDHLYIKTNLYLIPWRNPKWDFIFRIKQETILLNLKNTHKTKTLFKYIH